MSMGLAPVITVILDNIIFASQGSSVHFALFMGSEVDLKPFASKDGTTSKTLSITIIKNKTAIFPMHQNSTKYSICCFTQ